MPGIDSDTKLLLHGNGTDASTAITDSSASAHGNGTITGTVEIDTAQSNFGGASILFDNSSYVSYADSTDWDWTTVDLTIDCWVRFPSFGSNNTICARVTSGGSYMYFAFEGTGLRFRDFTGANNIDFTRSFATISNNTWHHVAVVRSGSTFRMFLDGIQQGADYTNANSWTNRSDAMDIGHLTINASYAFDGWIDELRITKGKARWVQNFEVPTQEYNNDTDLHDDFTKVILHCNGTDTSTDFPDESQFSQIVTAVGNAQVDTADSVFGGASLELDGAGDGLTIPHGDDFVFGTGDFTLDFRIKFDTLTNFDNIISLYDDGGSNRCLFYANADGSIKFFASSSATTIADFSTPTSAVTTGVWYHVSLVREGANEFIFIDGVSQSLSYTVNPTGATDYPDVNTDFRIGFQNFGFYVDGHMDEIRISKGIARWNTNFTPPSSEYGASGLSISINETVLINDSSVVNTNPEQVLVNETVLINDSTLARNNPESIGVNETVLINDSNMTNIPLTAKNASKIISVNPLYVVTNTDPAKIIEIDITDPVNPIFTEYTLAGAKNAKSVVYNSATDELFVACADGLVVKLDANDLSIQTLIDLSDTDDLLTISALNAFGLVYTGTENVVGELYTLDNSETFTMGTDFNVLAQKQFQIDSDFNTIEAFYMESNFEVLSELTFVMDTTFHCLTAPLDSITPIAQTDCEIRIDGVLLEDNDVLVQTVNVVKTVEQRDQASFNLCRQHDNPNKDYNGNTRAITSQNAVEIRIGGNVVFTGNVSRFLPDYSTDADTIAIEALGAEAVVAYNNVTLSLGSIDKRLSLYDILLQNFDIYNPIIDANSENPVKFNGIRVPLGEKIEEHVARRTYFDVFGKDAERIQAGTFIARQNHTYFWSPTVRKFGNHFYLVDPGVVTNSPVFNEPEPQNIGASVPNVDTDIVDKDSDKFLPSLNFDGPPPSFPGAGDITQHYFKYIGTSLTPVSGDLWFLLQAKHRRQKDYPNTIEKLGGGQVFIADLTDIVPNPTATLAELKAKGWLTATGFVTGKFRKTTDPKELSLTTGSCDNSGVYQVLSDALAYTVGSAPFLTVTARNGIYLAKSKWVDEPNGLYGITNEGYDYTGYVKKVAELEFQKLSNINGDILPETRATIEMSLDSLFYYNLKVLTRINVDNTTEPGVYKNLNGFPVAIKSLTIDCGTMRVTLECDNLKSNTELKQIDGEFPCEDDQQYITPRRRTLVALKSSMKTLLEIEGPKSIINEAGDEIPKVDQ